MTSFPDLLDLFDPDGDDEDQPRRQRGQPRRKGLRGLLDRLAGAFSGSDGDERAQQPGDQDGRARRARRQDSEGFDLFD